MHNPFVEKLTRFVDLSADDVAACEHLLAKRFRYPAHRDLVKEYHGSSDLVVVLSGWAMRHRLLDEGRQSTLGYLLPGDISDYRSFKLRSAFASITSLTQVDVSEIPLGLFKEILASSPSIARALQWCVLADDLIARQWFVNVTQLDALARVAHFLCEAWARADRVGFVCSGSMELPFTQQQLGDAVGVTGVHMNRVLQRLRNDHLITLSDRRLQILDQQGLQQRAGFQSAYLHPES